MIPIEHILLIGSLLILVSIGVARLSENLGVPVLLLFLGIGMLAGSEGLGGIYFDDAHLAQSVGVLALVFILFAGGLDTKWSEVRASFFPAVSLATVGVVLTAAGVGLFAFFALKLQFLTALLLGAVVSSTDAAAVFSVLRSKNISLKGSLRPLLELESGSNDPMAVLAYHRDHSGHNQPRGLIRVHRPPVRPADGGSGSSAGSSSERRRS